MPQGAEMFMKRNPWLKVVEWWQAARRTVSSLFVYDVTARIRHVRRIYADVDREMRGFRKAAGLGCPGRCGHCCANSNVETTVLEMLPLAQELLRRGEAERWCQEADTKDFPGQCVFYAPDENSPDQGRCRVYAWRPLICRMFGFTGNRDKYGRLRLVACRVMKQLSPHLLEEALGSVDAGKSRPPVMADFVMRASMVDPELSKDSLGINEAFQKAVERLWLARKFGR